MTLEAIIYEWWKSQEIGTSDYTDLATITKGENHE